MKQPDTTTTEGKIKLMQAFLNGKRIQFKLKNNNNWVEAKEPDWGWHDCEYRIAPNDLQDEVLEEDPYKPFINALAAACFEWGVPQECYEIESDTPKTRLWTMSDVPPICWLREKGREDFAQIVLTIDKSGVFIYAASKDWQYLADEYEYSINLKEWNPCVVYL